MNTRGVIAFWSYLMTHSCLHYFYTRTKAISMTRLSPASLISLSTLRHHSRARVSIERFFISNRRLYSQNWVQAYNIRLGRNTLILRITSGDIWRIGEPWCTRALHATTRRGGDDDPRFLNTYILIQV